MKSLFAILLLILPLHAKEVPPVATNFIRIHKTDTHQRLQTAITTYQKGETTVDLLGAIHIGDEAYYDRLNQEFKDYDVLLFELIGGESAAKFLNGKKRDQAKEADGRPAEGLRGLYSSFANTMKLAQQIDIIDYTPKNFVHADLTRAEYAKIMDGKEDDIFAFALETQIKNSELTGESFGGIDMGLMMRAILSGDSSILKIELMKNMDTGDEAAGALVGNNVIIGDRNAKAFRVLDKQLKKDKKRIGIFYGAAHFPDMEKRLLEMGFKKTAHEWLTAWDVALRKEKKSPESNS